MSFKIFDHDRLSKEVIPKHFRHGHLSSLQRQLNLYGFRHKGVYRGDDKGSFFHPMFIRGRRDLVEKIKRYNPNSCKKAGKARTSSDNYQHSASSSSGAHSSSSQSAPVPSRRNPPRERKARLSSDSVDDIDESMDMVEEKETMKGTKERHNHQKIKSESPPSEPIEPPRTYRPKQPVDVLLGPPLKTSSTTTAPVSVGDAASNATVTPSNFPRKLGAPIPQPPINPQATMYKPPSTHALFPAKTKRSALTARLGFVLPADDQSTTPRMKTFAGGELSRIQSFDTAVASFAEKHPSLFMKSGSFASLDVVNFGDDTEGDFLTTFEDDVDSSLPVGLGILL